MTRLFNAHWLADDTTPVWLVVKHARQSQQLLGRAQAAVVIQPEAGLKAVSVVSDEHAREVTARNCSSQCGCVGSMSVMYCRACIYMAVMVLQSVQFVEQAAAASDTKEQLLAVSSPFKVFICSGSWHHSLNASQLQHT